MKLSEAKYMSMLMNMLHYNKFINKYKNRITDIPSLDAVAKYYFVNKQDYDFANWHEGYVSMTNLEEDKNFEYPCGDIYENLPRKDVIFTDYTNKHFVQFNNRNTRRMPVEEQCKLWVNTSLENVGEVALLLAKFIDESDKTKHGKSKNLMTFFKTTYTTRRNDAITIYTNYKEADRIVEFLVELNPLVMKIDEFISYADLPHSESFPETISAYMEYVAMNKEIKNLTQRQQINYIKSLIIDLLVKQLKKGKCQDNLCINLKNFGIRHIGGKCTSNKNKKEVEKAISNLLAEKAKLLQGIDVGEALKQ
ncbi:MAG: hypothetical protein MJ152_03420 [Clostridia bacterium]|nr:hypothetical protein [Clostridia bacterium]